MRNRFNGFTNGNTRKPLKRLLGSEGTLIHRAEAAVRMRNQIEPILKTDHFAANSRDRSLGIYITLLAE